MKTQWIASPRCLSNSELIDRVRDLAGRERQATATLIAYLMELDERRLYAAEGYASLFVYCTEALHLSEGAAYNRIEAARAARKFPLILEKLADGSVHLAAVRLLVPHLTDENHRDLLEAATHRTRRDVERLIARIRPRAAVPSSVRKLPAAVPVEAGAGSADEPSTPKLDFDLGPSAIHQPDLAPSRVVAQPEDETDAGNVTEGDSGSGMRPAAERPPRAKEVPLSTALYSVHFTADAETYTALCQARELLRHQIPDGDAAAVIAMALKALVARLRQQKFAVRQRQGGKRAGFREPKFVERQRQGGKRAGLREPKFVERQRQGGKRATLRLPKCVATSGHENSAEIRQPKWTRGQARGRTSRHIPAEVKRRVWTRDQGRCAFVAHNGRRCTARGMLEFHHVEPFAKGGGPDVANIELRCRTHNRYEAELCFGRDAFNRLANRSREFVPGRVENVIFAPGYRGR